MPEQSASQPGEYNRRKLPGESSSHVDRARQDASQPARPPSEQRPGSSYRRMVDALVGTPVPDQPTHLLASSHSQPSSPGPGASAPGPVQSRRRRGRRRRVSGCVWAVLIFFGLLLVAGGVAATVFYLSFSNSLSQIVGQHASCAGGTTSNADQNRINILLLGSDTDEKFQGKPLAQTDIVVTIDTDTNTVGMLSIPRDFFLNIPGYGMRKLDEAYGLGGVSLSCRTIEQDFGIPLNYYAWVGLDGFIKVINTVGGVDVNVTHAIVDDNYPNDVNNPNDPYALERLYIAPGPQHLDGQEALEYVRSRHADLIGDFGRSARQQQVLTSLKGKLDNSSIIGQLSTIANELQGYVKTDMQLSDVLKVMNFARGLKTSDIHELVLGPPYSTEGTAPADAGVDAGASVVFPDCSRVVPAIQKLFQLGTCNIEGTPGVTSRGITPQPVTASPVSWQTPAFLNGNNQSLFQDQESGVGDAATSMLNGPGGLFGMRSVLELMGLVVFETPDGLQV